MPYSPTLYSVLCPNGSHPHRMAYWQWGAENSKHVLICVHGLTRQGRDFDVLAQALCQQTQGDIRVICPDLAGRGRSDWLLNPMEYHVPLYVADMSTLLLSLGLTPSTQVDWVGTSLGGLIGMAIAAQNHSLLRRLVLNDVGPVLHLPGLTRIASYVKAAPPLPSLQAGADYLWSISSTFGPHTPEQWLALSTPMFKRDAVTGQFHLHYDPGLLQPMRVNIDPAALAQSEPLLWAMYDQIQARTLVIRGADSDLLSQETAQAMTQRGPQAQLVEFAGVGHAPTLVSPDQVELVTRFLLN